MSKEETAFLANFLFGDEFGMESVERIDRRVDRLPGLAGLHLLHSAVTQVRSQAPVLVKTA